MKGTGTDRTGRENLRPFSFSGDCIHSVRPLSVHSQYQLLDTHGPTPFGSFTILTIGYTRSNPFRFIHNTHYWIHSVRPLSVHSQYQLLDTHGPTPFSSFTILTMGYTWSDPFQFIHNTNYWIHTVRPLSVHSQY